VPAAGSKAEWRRPGWATAVIPPAVGRATIYQWMSRPATRPQATARGGFEYLLAAPAALVAWLMLAPVAVYLVLGADPTAGPTGRWMEPTAGVSLLTAFPASWPPYVTVPVGLAWALAIRGWVVRREVRAG